MLLGRVASGREAETERAVRQQNKGDHFRCGGRKCFEKIANDVVLSIQICEGEINIFMSHVV